jgi:two-component system, OmpR family, sensor histidine kinase BaeS
VSFRLRVLALVAVVAVSAVGATAYLAYQHASRQVVETVTADRDTVNRIVADLVDYARRHGTWDGVAARVASLASATHQRIQLVAESGAILADSDVMQRRTPRGVAGPASVVDPRPVVSIGAAPSPAAVWEIAIKDISRYRMQVALAGCLTKHGLDVLYGPGTDGVPEYAPTKADEARDPTTVAVCEKVSASSDQLDDAAGVRRCQPALAVLPSPRPENPPLPKLYTRVDVAACLRQLFTEQTADVAPARTEVYVGAAGEAAAAKLTPGPVLAAAGLVALLALAGTALLSRRVLRPIGLLTAASRRLGDGDLTLRVPVRGHDEMSQLARSFNRMADSLQRGEERQRRLVADVAHELRTPLANLRGYLEALKDGVVPASPELFASLHEEAVLQQRIVDDLQDLALAEAGALAYHRTTTDLAELLETCLTAHQAAAEAAGVALRVRARPVLVDADPDRLRQVIGNLVTNALRATPRGGRVTLRAEGTGARATVSVQDTGRGIPAPDLPYIFDRFWRADQARHRTTGGAGLGLAIARQIVIDHSGRIEVASVVGTGTTVTVTLPALAADPS